MADLTFTKIESPSPATDKPLTFTKVGAPASAGDGAFFGLAKALPESVSQFLPGFMKGPSVGEQLSATQSTIEAAPQHSGKSILGLPAPPFSLSERLTQEPVTDSPVAMGFATHQIGEVPNITAKAIASHETALDKQFQRAVKPTGRLESSYKDRARSAVSSIIEKQPNLQFTDDAGNIIRGQKPETLEQFGQAIDQTKKMIYQEYDAKQRAAGAQGATVDLMPAIRELVDIATSRPVKVAQPELARYAAELAGRMWNEKAFSTSDAQEFIQNHNQQREAFYKNPSYDIAGRAAIDARVASALRKELDQTIERSVGPGYQDLKNKHGALQAIEKHVKHRAQVVGRQEPGGGLLGRLADVASTGAFIHGLASLNPATFATGIGTKAWAEYMKYRRSPNRAVRQLFERAEAGPQPIQPISPASPFMVPSDSDTMRRAASP